MKAKPNPAYWKKRLEEDLVWLRDKVPWTNERDHVRLLLTELLDVDPGTFDRFLEKQRGLRQAERHLDKVDPDRVLSSRYVNLRKSLAHDLSYAGPPPDGGKRRAELRSAIAELERILIPEFPEQTGPKVSP